MYLQVNMDYGKEKKYQKEVLNSEKKQKLRYMFGITEKQLKNYFKKASLKKAIRLHIYLILWKVDLII